MQTIRFMYDNKWDHDTLAYSSQDPNFPASNTRHRWWTKAWRSVGIASEYLKLTADSAIDVTCVALKYNNFTAVAQVILQANSEDDFNDPPFSSVLSPINQDVMIQFFDSVSYQYWRLVVADPTNDADYLTLGRVFIGTYWSPLKNFNNNYQEKREDPSFLVWSEGGQLSGILKTLRTRLTYQFEELSKTDKNTFRTIFQDRGLSKDFFICQDAEDDYSATHYVRFADNLSIDHVLMDNFFNMTIVVEDLL